MKYSNNLGSFKFFSNTPSIFHFTSLVINGIFLFASFKLKFVAMNLVASTLCFNFISSIFFIQHKIHQTSNDTSSKDHFQHGKLNIKLSLSLPFKYDKKSVISHFSILFSFV
jgi:hypothetical protein